MVEVDVLFSYFFNQIRWNIRISSHLGPSGEDLDLDLEYMNILSIGFENRRFEVTLSGAATLSPAVAFVLFKDKADNSPTDRVAASIA